MTEPPPEDERLISQCAIIEGVLADIMREHDGFTSHAITAAITAMLRADIPFASIKAGLNVIGRELQL